MCLLHRYMSSSFGRVLPTFLKEYHHLVPPKGGNGTQAPVRFPDPILDCLFIPFRVELHSHGSQEKAYHIFRATVICILCRRGILKSQSQFGTVAVWDYLPQDKNILML